MGSSLSKVFGRKDVTDETYHNNPQSTKTVRERLVETRWKHTASIGSEGDEVRVVPYHPQVNGSDEYYDDEEMIQFISTLSLVEYNQPPPKAVPAQPGTPDPFREFFLQLQAHATPGLSSWGKSPAKGKIPGLRKDDTAKKQECVICVEEKPLQHFPKITDSCQHPDQICLVCVQNWLAREADNTDWDKIHCVACKEIVPYNHMKRLMTKAAFEKYDQYSRNATLSKMPNFRWCISSSCSSGQIHEIDTDGYIFYCGACYTKTCVIHNVPWHEGETCTEYDYRQDPKVKAAEERASKIEIKGSSKPCPGPGCKVNITRNGGCEHMKCTRCNYEFCWQCLADFDQIRKNGNSFHEKSCKLHSENLPDH